MVPQSGHGQAAPRPLPRQLQPLGRRLQRSEEGPHAGPQWRPARLQPRPLPLRCHHWHHPPLRNHRPKSADWNSESPLNCRRARHRPRRPYWSDWRYGPCRNVCFAMQSEAVPQPRVEPKADPPTPPHPSCSYRRPPGRLQPSGGTSLGSLGHRLAQPPPKRYYHPRRLHPCAANWPSRHSWPGAGLQQVRRTRWWQGPKNPNESGH